MFSTTLKKIHWDKKKKSLETYGHFYEYKSMTDHWIKRLKNIQLPVDAVFLVGQVSHRLKLVEITTAKTQFIPDDCQQEITTPHCYVLKIMV
ncbi:hypothetical protein [Sulfuricurvum sp.]|uniref:hypothetical protein n=1 Tax=Sulfuricurvum sp. TaxID=2025608 RepID=UPI003562FA93